MALAIVNFAMLIEMRHGADQQHIDTLAALGKNDETIAAMKTQAGIMQGQLNEMQAEQRAWVYAQTSIGKRIGESGEFYYIPLTLYYHNTGHLPAFFVTPKMTAKVIAEGFSLANARNEICDDYRRRLLNNTDEGQTIFPAEEHRASITNVEVKKSDWIDRNNASRGTAMLVIGCVDYRYPGDKAHHQTRFGFVIGAAGPNGAVLILPSNPTSVDIAINGANQGMMDSAD